MLVDPKWMRFYARMSGAVMAKVVFIALGLWLGQLLDERFGTYPLFLFVCVTAALALGIFWIVWLAEKETARMEQSEKQTKAPLPPKDP
jgi:F0F1-type ATP synthase assembly protein I